MAFNRAFFLTQKAVGDIGESRFEQLAQMNKSFKSIKKVNFRTHHYDFETLDINGKVETWEIKSVKKVKKPWEQFTAETETYDKKDGFHKVPEYITHRDTIDYIVYYDDTRETFYFYNNKKFAEWVLANKDSEVKNRYNTAKVVKFHMEDPDLGFLLKFDVSGLTFQ